MMFVSSKNLMLGVAATSLLFAAACGKHQATVAEIDLEPLEAEIVQAELLQQHKVIELFGTVEPAREAQPSSRVMGQVVAVRVQAGSVVRPGQPLVEIRPETAVGALAQAEGAAAQAKAALTLAERNFKRFEALHAEAAASEVELDMARMQYEQAQGAVIQAEGAVQAAASVAEEAVVRAPFTARVVDKLIEVGDLAAPGRPLVRLESLAGRSLRLSVRESDIRRLSVGQELPVSIDARPDLGTIPAEVVEIVPSADPATHTFTVKVGLGDADVASGLSGRAFLDGDGRSSIVIPATAVHKRGGLELVIVRSDDGTARTRAVTTGAEIGDGRIEILSGVADGDSVVVDAPAPVADGTPIKVRS